MVSLGRVGQYELLRKLPHGGNADVFVAVADGSDREMALKRLRAKPGSEPWRRFAQEVRVVAQLDTFPGILPIVDSGVPDNPQPDDHAWYSMPLAKRVDEVLRGARLEDVVRAMAAYAETLTRLHAIAHYHRDVKPANLYCLDGQWLVGDFGIVDVPDAEAITKAGKRFGPANFLPYELITNPDTAEGGPVDVYELAKTLWVLAADEWLLTQGGLYAPLGPQPADGGKFTLNRILAGHPLASRLDELIERCTRTDPDLRPHMAQVHADLQAWVEMAERRDRGDDNTPLAKAAAELRAAFADHLTAGELRQQQVEIARERITSLRDGIERLAEELRRELPGGVTISSHNPTVLAALGSPRVDQAPDAVMTAGYAVVVKLDDDGFRPEVLLAIVTELEQDGRLSIRAGAFLDYPGLDAGESEVLYRSDALVDSVATDNAIEGSIAALRAAAPNWLTELRRRSA